MIGGFMGTGSPHRLIGELVRQGRKNLTIIANDTARPGFGIGRLIDAKLVQTLVVSHIGTNPETQRQMIAGEITVDLVPQGTLAERIRAAGYGLAGVLTPTGVGTLVAEGAVDRGRGQDISSGIAYRGRFRSDRRPPCRLPRQVELRTSDGLRLKEVAAGVSAQDVAAVTDARLVIPTEAPTMRLAS